MFNKNITCKIIYLFSILLVAIVARAEEIPELPLNEDKKTQDQAMWDNADEMFNAAPVPTAPKPPIDATDNDDVTKPKEQNPTNNIETSSSMQSSANTPGNEKNSNDDNATEAKIVKKLPIGRTNTFLNGNFKQKSTPEYAKFELIGPNKNLPPVYFESNLVGDAFEAVKKNDINALRYLIKNYDLENFVDESGDNLLLKAASEGQVNILRMLLVNKYDINFLNANKMSALHIAVAKEDMNMVKTLLTMKIDANLQDNNGETALDYAKEINTEVRDFIVSYLN